MSLQLPDANEIREIVRQEIQAALKQQPQPAAVLQDDGLDLVSRKQLIEILGISAPTFSDWLSKGLLPPAKKIGRRIYFSRNELLESMQQHQKLRHLNKRKEIKVIPGK